MDIWFALKLFGAIFVTEGAILLVLMLLSGKGSNSRGQIP